MNNAYFANEIKSRLKMGELLRRYGFDIGRGNRIACPFHNGKDKNLAFKGDFWHCFVCGEGGDTISFVQKYFNLSFSEAIAKLNDDFCLCLPIGEKIDRRKQIEMEKEIFQRKQAIKQREAKLEVYRTAYFDAIGQVLRLEENKRLYAPKMGDSEMHPLFVEALQNIEAAHYRVEIAEQELREYEKQTDGNS